MIKIYIRTKNHYFGYRPSPDSFLYVINTPDTVRYLQDISFKLLFLDIFLHSCGVTYCIATIKLWSIMYNIQIQSMKKERTTSKAFIVQTNVIS